MATAKKKHPGKEGNKLRIPLEFEALMAGILKVKPWAGMKKRETVGTKVRRGMKPKKARR